MIGIEDRPHWLYEFRSADGECLYVGITVNLPGRINGHTRKPWWEDVARVEVNRYPNRAAVLTAEAKLIAERAPKHNILGREGVTPGGGWAVRRDNIAARHAAGQLCRDQICRDCTSKAHAAEMSCFKPFHCPECIGFMPNLFALEQPREADCWRELAARHGGEQANRLCWAADGAFKALCVDEDDSAWLVDRQQYALRLALESIRAAS